MKELLAPLSDPDKADEINALNAKSCDLKSQESLQKKLCGRLPIECVLIKSKT